jgi:hypothetical protein
MSNFMKIRLMGKELFHAGRQAGRQAGGRAGGRAGGQAGRQAGGQTGRQAGRRAGRQAGGSRGRHDDANSRSSQFCERAKNDQNSCTCTSDRPSRAQASRVCVCVGAAVPSLFLLPVTVDRRVRRLFLLGVVKYLVFSTGMYLYSGE